MPFLSHEKNLYSWCADGYQVFVTNGIENIKIIFLFLLLFTYTKKGDHSYHSIHTKMHNRYNNHVLNSFLCTLFMNNIDLNTHSLKWLPLHSFFKLKVVPDLNINAVQAGCNVRSGPVNTVTYVCLELKIMFGYKTYYFNPSYFTVSFLGIDEKLRSSAEISSLRFRWKNSKGLLGPGAFFVNMTYMLLFTGLHVLSSYR